MDAIMGFIDWMMNGFKVGADGTMMSGIKESIAKHAVGGMGEDANQLLSQNAPGVHQGVRDYIVEQVKTQGEQTAGLAPATPRRGLADIAIGENVAAKEPAKPLDLDSAAREISGQPAAPSTTPAAPASQTPETPAAPATKQQPDLNVVLYAMSKNVLMNPNISMTPQERDATAKEVARVGADVIKNNPDLIKNKDFDGLSSKLADAIMADPKLSQTINDKVPVYATNSKIKKTLKAGIQEQLALNKDTFLAATAAAKDETPKVAYNPDSTPDHAPRQSPITPGRVGGAEQALT
jgi:hypothetical protein